jgi:hypothetical protein
MSQLSLPCASRNVTETQGVDISLMACPKNLANYYISLCAHHQELMKSAGSCSSSLLFMMKVTVCLFKSNSLKVLTALIVTSTFQVLLCTLQSHIYAELAVSYRFS